jgi:hypothetical protein
MKHSSLEKTVDVGGISIMKANTLGVTTILNQGKVFPMKTKKGVILHKTQMVISKILHGALETFC